MAQNLRSNKYKLLTRSRIASLLPRLRATRELVELISLSSKSFEMQNLHWLGLLLLLMRLTS